MRLVVAWLVARNQLLQATLVTVVYAFAAGLVIRLFVPSSQLASAWLVLLAVAASLAFVTWRLSNSLLGRMTRVVESIGPINTTRLHLRAPRSSDAKSLAHAFDDEAFAANGWTEPVRRGWLRAIKAADVICITDEWVVTGLSDGSILGSVSVSNVDRRLGTCHVGWWMGSDERGKGYGTEAVGAVLVALHADGFRRVMIGTRTDNEPVKRVAVKVGARRVEDGDHKLPNGVTVLSAWYAHDASSTAASAET
jgi:ribosomal-protein-alanine N-acetyltransferase